MVGAVERLLPGNADDRNGSTAVIRSCASEHQSGRRLRGAWRYRCGDFLGTRGYTTVHNRAEELVAEATHNFPSTWSAPFSATMMVGALVLHEGTRGITEASTTRRPVEADDAQIRRHDARRIGSPGRCGRCRPDGGRSWRWRRRSRTDPASVSNRVPGRRSASTKRLSAGWRMISRARRRPAMRELPVVAARTSSSDRCSGAAVGSALASRTVPRERGRR